MVAYSFQDRFIGPIRAGLGIPHRNERGQIAIPGPKPKRQTIRAVGKRRHAREGDALQLYWGMRNPRCFLIGRATCTGVLPIIIWVPPTGALVVERAHKLLMAKDLALFSQLDGFADPDDMAAFWRKEHEGIEKFEGFLITWCPNPHHAQE